MSRALSCTGHNSNGVLLHYVVVRNSDQRVIGRLSLREVQGRVSARLGIHLGADYVDSGYGTEALRLFLSHYFRSLGFQRLDLDVAAINERAIHVYRKLGFRRTGSHYRNVPASVDLGFLERDQYRSLGSCFRRRLGRVQLQFVNMVLQAGDWHADRTESISSAASWTEAAARGEQPLQPKEDDGDPQRDTP
jgi:hypothetical protein